jgi:hypothetical protein
MGKEASQTKVNRRGLLKGLAALPLAYGLSKVNAAVSELSVDHSYISEDAVIALQELKGSLPKGKLGKYEISRLVMGCNPMGGWSHSRDLAYVGTLSRNWHTPEKMKETWAVGERAGINLANLTADMYPTFNEYKKETGCKLMSMCQCSIGHPNDRLAPLKQAVQDGADFIYIQGQFADNLAISKSLDVLIHALEYVWIQSNQVLNLISTIKHFTTTITGQPHPKNSGLNIRNLQ